MMSMSNGLEPLVSLKGFPAQTRPTIECVGATEKLPSDERWGRLKDCMGRRLLALPSRSKNRRVDNLISAQALPTAAKFGLIRGKPKRRELTYNGRRLLETSADSELFNLRFGKVILELDSEKWHVVEAVRMTESYPGARVPYAELVLSLARLGIDAVEDLRAVPSGEHRHLLEESGVTWNTGASRLSDLLQFYDWVDILRYRTGSITLLHSRIGDILEEELERPVGSVPADEFFQTLAKEYDFLARDIYRSPFVPIKSRLLQGVCERLLIGERHFTTLLLKLPNVYAGRQILLSPYRHPKPSDEVIETGKQQYYFVSMYDLDEEGGES